ncbi:hypothetical protein ABPG74_019400 [Tetrahymena malaccensis]
MDNSSIKIRLQKYMNPIISVGEIYNQSGDPQLLNMYKMNSNLLSSWALDGYSDLRQLNYSQLYQIQLGSSLDFLRKSLIYSAQQKSNQHFSYFKTITDSHFLAYSLDGMFYGPANNITYKNISSNGSCIEGQYTLDARCQSFFIQVTQINSTFAQLYSPTLFLYSSNDQPNIKFGICKKQYLNYSRNINFNQQIKGNTQQFQLVCNSIKIQSQQMEAQTHLKQIRILLDPSTQRVIYQNNYIIQDNILLTIQESYLRKLSKKNSEYFSQQIKDFYTSQKINQCFNNYFDFQVFIQNSNNIYQQFSFYEDGNEMVVFMQLSYMTDVQKNNQSQVKQFCQSSVLLFLTIFSKNELQSQSIDLLQKILTIDLAFKVLIYVIPCLQILFAAKYVYNYSYIINQSIQYIINILKCIKIQQQENKIQFLEKKSLQLQRNIDDSQIIFSQDILEIYQNVHDLLFTFLFYTFNMLGQDQFLSLSQFTQYINHFKKYNSYSALGICLNNVGCINFNNSRYHEAFDYFSQAIICSKYELKQYKEDSKNQQQNHFENKLSQNQTISIIVQAQQINSQKSQIIKKLNQEKINSNQFYCKSADSYQVNQNQHKEIQNKKIAKNQIDLFSKYKNRVISSKKAELFDIYFYRTVNYLKSLIYCMCLNMNILTTDWDIAEEVIYTLKKINDLKINQPILQIRNKLVINRYHLIISLRKRNINFCQNIIEENELIFMKHDQLVKQQSQKTKQQLNNEKEFDDQQTQLNSQKQSNINYQNEQLYDESKCQNSQNQLLQSKFNILQLSSAFHSNQDFILSQNSCQNKKNCFYNIKQFNNQEFDIFINDNQNNQKTQINNSTINENELNKYQNSIQNSQINYQVDYIIQKQQNFHQKLQNTLYKGQDQKNENFSLLESKQSNFSQVLKYFKTQDKKKKKKINQQKENKNSGKNLLNFKEESIYGMYLEQKAILNLAKQNFYSAADYFTKILEESKFIFPFMLNQSIQKLIQIFNSFNINDQTLDQMYNQMVSLINYKISFVYFNSKIYDYQLNKEQYLFDLNSSCSQPEDSITFSLIEDILNEIISYNDDQFGFIYSNYYEMIIEEPILMTKYHYIKIYKNKLLKQLNDCYFNQQNQIINNNRNFFNKYPIVLQDSIFTQSKQLNNQYNQHQKQNNLSYKASKHENFNDINLDKQQTQTSKFIQDNYQTNTESNIIFSNHQSKIFNLLYDRDIKKQQDFIQKEYLNNDCQSKNQEYDIFITSNQSQNKNIQSIYHSKLNHSKIQQIQLISNNKEDQKQFDLKINNKQKDHFYYTIRKAIQQVMSQNEGLSILFKIKQIQFDKANKHSHIIIQHNQYQKKSYMQNNMFPNLMKKILYKKIIVAVIDNMNIFSQNEKEFKFILQNLQNYSIELCIVILDENVNLQESNSYQNITHKNKNLVSFFHNFQSLLAYLNSNRYSKFHDSTLLYTENF